jgi:transcriptional regulator ATRX
MASVKGVRERAEELLKWKRTGGVMIMGYQLFRLLANYPGRSKRSKEAYAQSLIDPGPCYLC